MKRSSVFVLFVFLLYSFKPISHTDKEVEILYLCDCNGQFEFDQEGSSGLATLSELKRRESEKLKPQDGVVLLFSGGNFFGKGKEMRSNFKLLSQVPFDAVFLTEEELAYLDSNLALKSLNLPLVTSKKNLFGISEKKEFEFGEISLVVSDSILKEDKRPKKSIRVFFFLEDTIPKLSASDLSIVIKKQDKNSNYLYKSRIYEANCPAYNQSIGKINLTFRNGEVIRHSQEFVYLNSVNRNRSWIDPNRSIVNELK